MSLGLWCPRTPLQHQIFTFVSRNFACHVHPQGGGAKFRDRMFRGQLGSAMGGFFKGTGKLFGGGDDKKRLRQLQGTKKKTLQRLQEAGEEEEGEEDEGSESESYSEEGSYSYTDEEDEEEGEADEDEEEESAQQAALRRKKSQKRLSAQA